MDRYGLKNVTKKELAFHYDKHYKEVALALKRAKTEEEKKR